MYRYDLTESHEQSTEQETPPVLREGLRKDREDTTSACVN